MPREPRPTRSLLPATLAAVAGGALVGGLLFASVLKGPLALVVLAVLGIALPVARTLAERVVVLMVGYAGILFSLWMLPLPHGDLLGAAIGAGFGWSLVRGLQTGRLSRLVPQLTTALIMKEVRRGSIILLHDIQPSTAKALPGIISQLKAQGYTLVTVPQLLGATTAGRVYNGQK
ncbi:MAG TPA: hypothetical protein PKX10_03405 [Propioniciclava tarda]|nr:hypothetical protein [Propioniciclava tarda]HQD60183.1 hypothetical protein [Propioniciclava tarda]